MSGFSTITAPCYPSVFDLLRRVGRFCCVPGVAAFGFVCSLLIRSYLCIPLPCLLFVSTVALCGSYVQFWCFGADSRFCFTFSVTQVLIRLLSEGLCLAINREKLMAVL